MRNERKQRTLKTKRVVRSASAGTAACIGTTWSGGGKNAGGETEQGLTLSFNGTGIAGTISIQANQYSTTNNARTPTSNVQNSNVTFS